MNKTQFENEISVDQEISGTLTQDNSEKNFSNCFTNDQIVCYNSSHSPLCHICHSHHENKNIFICLTDNFLIGMEAERVNDQKTKVNKNGFTNIGFIETEVESDPKYITVSDKETDTSEDTKEDETHSICWTQIIAAISSSTVHLCIGTILGFTGVTLPSMMDHNANDLVLTHQEASIFSSIVNIGAIIGSIASSFLACLIGQRSIFLIFMPIGMASWILLGLAPNIWALILSRFIHGIVIGMTAGSAGNYVVEIAHSKYRGRLSGLVDLFRQVGFLYVYAIGSSHISWRSVGLLCGISSMALPFISMIFLPHSPRWLATRGRNEEAKKALAFFRGPNYDVTSEMNDILQRLKNNQGNITVIDQIKELKKKHIFIRFIVLAVLLYATHFTGNFAMIAYSVSIFKSAGVASYSYLSTILAAITRIIGVIFYLQVADKFNRKPLFIVPTFMAGVCMITLGVFFYLKLVMEDVTSIAWLPIASLVLYTMFACISEPVLMLLRAELLPNSIRAAGVGVLYFIFFLGAFSVTISYHYMVDSIGSHWTFGIYGTTSFIMVIITTIFIPETQGKTLEEIDQMKKQSKPA